MSIRDGPHGIPVRVSDDKWLASSVIAMDFNGVASQSSAHN